MSRHYSSFVVRCWIDGTERRIQIEQVQSHQRIRTDSFEEAREWIERQATDPEHKLTRHTFLPLSEPYY